MMTVIADPIAKHKSENITKTPVTKGYLSDFEIGSDLLFSSSFSTRSVSKESFDMLCRILNGFSRKFMQCPL